MQINEINKQLMATQKNPIPLNIKELSGMLEKYVNENKNSLKICMKTNSGYFDDKMGYFGYIEERNGKHIMFYSSQKQKILRNVPLQVISFFEHFQRKITEYIKANQLDLFER